MIFRRSLTLGVLGEAAGVVDKPFQPYRLGTAARSGASKLSSASSAFDCWNFFWTWLAGRETNTIAGQ
jgi:hypothetical protein